MLKANNMKQDPTEETSARTFQHLLLDELVRHRGWMWNEEFIAICKKKLGRKFSKADKVLIRNRPKWQNQVDFAKSVLTSKKLIFTKPIYVPVGERFGELKGKSHRTVIVLAEHAYLVNDVMHAKKQSSFTKKCPECGDKNRPLGERLCGESAPGGCQKYIFPEPNQRVYRDWES